MSRPHIAAGVALLGLSACAAQSFDPHFKTRELPSERTILQDLQKPEPRDERPVAVGISEAPQRLCAWDLRAGLLWEHAIEAKSAPLVVGQAIVTAEAGGIVVRDLERGEVRVVVDEEGQLVGADGVGNALVIAIAYPPEHGPRGAIVYVKDFRVRWKQSLKLPVGVPALVGKRVLVPWATQRLSVLDADDGSELVRWHMNNTVLGHALVDHGRVYVGQHGLVRLDAQLLKPGSTPTLYVPFQRSLPGQPPLLRDGYLPLAAPDNAYHKVQLDFRIGSGDAMSAENDLLALRFYRLLFALDARGDEILWTRSFEHDLIGSAIQPGGLFVADSHGTLRFIDKDGSTRMSSELGRPLQVLAIRPGSFVPAAPAATAPPPAPAAATAEGAAATATAAAAAPAAAAPAALDPPLPASRTEQLYAAAALADDRLGGGRAYAVEHLARDPDAAVTTQLIDLCSDRKSPEPVRMRACGELAKREHGGEQVVQALRNRASFLEDRPAPPLSALAEAAARMQLKDAAPLLIGHMEDPNTPVPALVSVLETLERLEHRPAVPAIERFVRLHHAEPEGSELAPALLAAVHALGSLRARPARPTLEDIAHDGLTAAAVRERAREAIGLIDTPVAAAAPKPAPEPEVVEEADDVQTEPQAYALTKEVIRQTLTPMRRRLGACLNADPSKPRVARVSMVVHGQGQVEGVFVTPTTLQACIEPILGDARFPTTRAGRQRITHLVYGANAEQTVKPAPAKKPVAKKQPKPSAPSHE